MAGQSVVISVLADTKQFSSGLSSAGKDAGLLSSTMKGVGVAVGAALVAATAAAAGFVAASIKAAGEAEKIAAQTGAVLASTGGAAQRSAEQIGDLANELSKLSGVDDEVIQAGENVLLTFTRIQGANFDKATAAALDMSVALGKDLNSSATLVGKALNDPIAGIGALSRVGVQLTQEQKDLIASMVEVGDVAGAQGVILQELNTQFGGSAAAFGDTFEGAVGKMRTAFGNVQETVGAAFLPAITAAFSQVAGALNGLAESPAFQAIISNIGSFITSLLSGDSAIGGLVAQIAPLLSYLSPLGLAFKVLEPLLPTIADALGQVASTIGGALMAVLPTVAGALQQVAGILSGALASILPVLIPVVLQLAQVIGNVLAAVLPIVGTLLESFAEILTALIPVVMPIIDAVLGIVQAFLPLVELIASLIGPLLTPLIELLTALLVPILDLIAPLLELLAPALQFVAEVLATVIGWVVQAVAFFLQLITGSEEAKAGVENVWNGILDFFEGIPKAIGDFFAGAVNWLVDAGKNIIDGLLNGLKDAIEGVWSWIEDVGQGIADTFAGILGIHSPSRVFAGYGKNIVQGLVDGLSDTARLSAAMDALSADVAGGFSAQLEAPDGYRAASSGGNNYTIQLPVGMPSAEAGRAIVQAIEEYERFGGRR